MSDELDFGAEQSLHEGELAEPAAPYRKRGRSPRRAAGCSRSGSSERSRSRNPAAAGTAAHAALRAIVKLAAAVAAAAATAAGDTLSRNQWVAAAHPLSIAAAMVVRSRRVEMAGWGVQQRYSSRTGGW